MRLRSGGIFSYHFSAIWRLTVFRTHCILLSCLVCELVLKCVIWFDFWLRHVALAKSETANLTEFGIFMGSHNPLQGSARNMARENELLVSKFTWISASCHACEARNLNFDQFWNTLGFCTHALDRWGEILRTCSILFYAKFHDDRLGRNTADSPKFWILRAPVLTPLIDHGIFGKRQWTFGLLFHAKF